MSINNLTREEQETFDMFNERFGLPSDGVNFDAGESRPVVFSGDPMESDIEPFLIRVASIHELNKLVGAHDEADDSHIFYPPPLKGADNELLKNSLKTGMDLLGTLDDKLKIDFRMAKSAYILGNSNKVKEYEDIINTVYFPTLITVFSSLEPLYIYPDTIIKKTTYAVLHFPSIIYEPGGKLSVEAPAIICTTSIKPDNDGNVTVKASRDDIPALPKIEPPAAPNGPKDPALDGTNGVSHQINGQTGQDYAWYCRREPQDGDVGHQGGIGMNGQPGKFGTAMSDITFNVTGDVMGKLVIYAGGQNGQDGQAAQDGGNGGPGGAPGNSDAHDVCKTLSKPGLIGVGGSGGIGGNGGNGGDGANLIININGSLSGGLEIIKTAANAGQGGQSGKGGTGSKPGNSPGSGLKGDKNGSPTNIVLNGKRIGPS